MPRKPRMYLPGVPCHIIQRGNNQGERVGRMSEVMMQRYHNTEWNYIVPDWYGLGISLENQTLINRHVPQLLNIPGFRIAVIEPILGEIDISPYIDDLDWVIVGSETGEGCRPAKSNWFRKLRDATKAAGKPFFIKQLGTSHKSPARELDGRTWDEFPDGYIKKVTGVKESRSRAADDLLVF